MLGVLVRVEYSGGLGSHSDHGRPGGRLFIWRLFGYSEGTILSELSPPLTTTITPYLNSKSGIQTILGLVGDSAADCDSRLIARRLLPDSASKGQSEEPLQFFHDQQSDSNFGTLGYLRAYLT